MEEFVFLQPVEFPTVSVFMWQLLIAIMSCAMYDDLLRITPSSFSYVLKVYPRGRGEDGQSQARDVVRGREVPLLRP